MTYDKGDRVRLTALIKNLSGTLIDPTTITLSVFPPDRTEVNYTYGVGLTIVKDAVGTYHADIDLPQSGTWSFVWAGTGAVVAAEQHNIFVRKRSF
jgi:hypothetical protein